tara:strand:+ start:3031 stop:3555 length:525 start_codon:yes stop_codon:yes gene_type:complete
MKTNNSVFHIIENFISEKDAKQFIDFFNTNENLCNDVEEEHKHRNIHYDDIKNEKIKNLLDYYAIKNSIFIDHLFKTKTTLWQTMRLCRWNEGETMALHIDRNVKSRTNNMDYSSLLYLNDDYEGGELIFNTEILKMKKFSCIVFESDIHIHGVRKILKNKRYTIPSWYQKINE